MIELAGLMKDNETLKAFGNRAITKSPTCGTFAGLGTF